MAKHPNRHLADIIASNVRLAREETGLSQREFADRLSTIADGRAVSRWERGEYSPGQASLIELSEATGRDVAWFYTDHDRIAA